MRIFTFIICLLLSSCNKSLFEETEKMSVGSRGVIEDDSTTNPNLISDWENVDKIVISNGNTIVAPWASGASISSNQDFAKDVLKKDGWVMLFHTFKELSSYPQLNYMFLYNKLTGFLKVFYYNEQIANNPNGALWHFKTMDGSPTSFFNLNGFIALPDNSSTRTNELLVSNTLQSFSGAFQLGWNGFEMEIPYSKDYRKIYFSLMTHNKSISNYNFSGTADTKIEGTIVKTVSGSNGLFNAVATLGGNGAKSLIGKMKKKVDDGLAKDTTGTIKAKFGTKIVNALSKLATGDFKSAILSGLKLIFGSSTATETQKVNLSAKTQLTMDGTSTDIGGGMAMQLGNLNLYALMNSQLFSIIDVDYNNIVLHDRFSNEEQFMGVWTILSKPIVRISRYGKVLASRTASIGDSESFIQTGMLYAPNLLGITADVLVNPNLKPYITKKEITTEIVYAKKVDDKPYYSRFGVLVGEDDLIYSDKSLSLFESPFNKGFQNDLLLGGVKVPNFYDYYYDWGTDVSNNILVVVSVNLEYNYLGNVHKISSSRTYHADCLVDTSYDQQILRSGRYRNAYVVNTGLYPLESR